jgi:hypothetical protein
VNYDKIGQGGKLGQCFTPDAVADLVAAAIPEEDLLRTDYRVADPCCGSGSLIGAVVRRRLGLGVPPAVVAAGIWACDIDEAQVRGCVERLVELLGEEYREVLTASVHCQPF